MNKILQLVLLLIILAGPNAHADPEEVGSALSPRQQKMLKDWRIITSVEYKDGKVGGRAEGLISAAPLVVWEILIETDNWKNFIPRVKESREVPKQFIAAFKKEGWGQIAPADIPSPEESPRRKGAIWEVYPFEVFDFPWPVSDRWVINRLINDESNGKRGEYRGDWEMLFGNFRHNEGYWSVRPYSENPDLSHFAIYMLSDPGVDVPGPLIRIGNHFTLPAIVRGVRKEVSRRLFVK